MYEILRKEKLNDTTILIEVYAPMVAKKALAGQFIILRATEDGERVPFTIADYNRETGTVTVIFQVIGKSTMLLSRLEEGDSLPDFAGPLGKPSELEGVKRAAVIGGGVGCAIAYPVAKALHEQGSHVDIIAGFRDKDLVILENEMKAASTNLYITTDNGSYGEKGFVTTKLKELIDSGEQYDEIVAIGPVVMMKFVCETTRPYGIKTVVSLNPIMIDGTGMCGGCRVTVGGTTRFACIDGPEFDGHEVDFDELMSRNAFYKEKETHDSEHTCNLIKKADELAADSKKAIPMPTQEPDERIHNFSEVALGYTAEQAIAEAKRCIGCKNAPCVKGCPVNVDIPAFIDCVAKGDFEAGYQIIARTSTLPAVCGRVCPQETQCEAKCTRGFKGESVAIGNLERFVADWHLKHASGTTPKKAAPTGKRVAVVGSGPAGLTCAGDLAGMGHQVTIFENLHLAGGVLVYGIPEFRLPKSIVASEIETLKAKGVEVQTGVVVGRTITIDELFEEGYDSVFIGSGAGLPNFLGIEGESLLGVYSSNEYLTRINLMKAYDANSDTPIAHSKKVIVVGGGNVAMDAARCARRLGAEVSVVYRRSMQELPARAAEVHHAIEEGIQFNTLHNPTRIVGDENGYITGMECIQMELGEPDESGRRSPKEIPGSEVFFEADCVIIAVGTSPNPIISSTTNGLDTNRRGCIVADAAAATTREGVYAGGDAVTGAATVILAMGAGKTAAESINNYLNSK